MSDLKADIIIYGHIHTPYLQKIYNRLIINTGSVGNAVILIKIYKMRMDVTLNQIIVKYIEVC